MVKDIMMLSFPRKWMPKISKIKEMSKDIQYFGQYEFSKSLWLTSYIYCESDVVTIGDICFWYANGSDSGYKDKCFISFVDLIEGLCADKYFVEYEAMKYPKMYSVLGSYGYALFMGDEMCTEFPDINVLWKTKVKKPRV